LKLLLNGASRNRQHADIAKDCGHPNVALTGYAYQEAVPLLLAVLGARLLTKGASRKFDGQIAQLRAHRANFILVPMVDAQVK
jgi:hypothetical protein